ncbi:MAG: hypothetical protein SOZ45_02415 [Ruminococcus sp.]|nr:hypothetical protein [Ruminococcus sp.]
MVGFLYKGNTEISMLFDKRLSETFGCEVINSDLAPEGQKLFHHSSAPFKDDYICEAGIYRYLCINSNTMLFSHNIMSNGAVIPQANPSVNFYITVNVKSPKTIELVKDVRSIQEIWHDFGLCPEGEPVLESTNLAFDLFDSGISYSELNDEIRNICGGETDFCVEHNSWGGGFQCYYKNSPCSVEDLFSIFN